MEKLPLKKPNFIVLTLTPLLAVIFVPWYGFTVGYDAFELGIFAFFMVATGLAVTAGYHRLWSHRAYEAHWALRLWHAVWGACAMQNSILHWCADHRQHHRFVDDNNRDPYSAPRGFWHSHMGWIIRKQTHIYNDDFANVKDLQRDPIVIWQNKYYLLLTVLTNAGVPLALGWWHGQLWGTFLLAGLLRLVLNHHFTFFINSLAHMWGRQTYTDANTARDNGLIALLTYGEGYHNYHHLFQWDYRNGVRWWQFDPTKWVIRLCSWVGLATQLRQPPVVQIEKARLSMQLKQALQQLEHAPEPDAWRARLEEAHSQFLQILDEFNRFSQEWRQAKSKQFQEHLDKLEMKRRYAELKAELSRQRQAWRQLLTELSGLTPARV